MYIILQKGLIVGNKIKTLFGVVIVEKRTFGRGFLDVLRNIKY